MSAVQDGPNVWSNVQSDVKSKYEKCLNITEEIYKRINITFEIKKLETTTQSELSDHSEDIDINEIGNETDLFACDKSDITSSTEPEKTGKSDKNINKCEKYININNNEEKIKAAAVVYKRPKKRFRKRVKKRQTKSNKSDTEGSSDEALPLSRIIDIDTKCKSGEEQSKSDSPDVVMGVPKIIIITKDLKARIKQPQEKYLNKETLENKPKSTKNEIEVAQKQNKPTITNKHEAVTSDLSMARVKDKGVMVLRSCTVCSLSFRGERGLRRHMTMSHIENPEVNKKTSKAEQ